MDTEENQKQDSRVPTDPTIDMETEIQNQERRSGSGSLRSRLQAHLV